MTATFRFEGALRINEVAFFAAVAERYRKISAWYLFELEDSCPGATVKAATGQVI
jgi:hypothetical protein